MKAWLVRAGSRGEGEGYNAEHEVARIGFNEVGDLSRTKSSPEVGEIVQRSLESGASRMRVSNVAAQLNSFANRMEINDLVVMPLKTRAQIAIGRVMGNYAYRKEPDELRHVRPVKWLRMDIPRTAFGQDLLLSFGALQTVCRIKRNGAERRIQAVLDGKPDPGMGDEGDDAAAVAAVANGDESAEEAAATRTDVARVARDQVLAHVATHFTGHGLARLVDAVLRVDGYVTEVSDPGPDGGVDILAARGSLGFDAPRLCVQVKATRTPADVKVLRELGGTMSNFKADQGLFVSWSGYNTAAWREARQSFFTLRLWDADDLIEAVFNNYDRLPEDLRQELPLKRVWALVLEE